MCWMYYVVWGLYIEFWQVCFSNVPKWLRKTVNLELAVAFSFVCCVKIVVEFDHSWVILSIFHVFVFTLYFQVFWLYISGFVFLYLNCPALSLIIIRLLESLYHNAVMKIGSIVMNNGAAVNRSKNISFVSISRKLRTC